MGKSDDKVPIHVKDPKGTNGTENNPGLTFANRLFKSDRHTFTCLKAILGTVAGIMAGGIVFVILVYSFNYPYDLAGYICCGFTIIASVSLALSVHVRCIMALTVPSLFTSRGRVAILSLIFGLLLSRPIRNISNNMSEVSRSMACSTELFHNQTYSLRQQLEVPIEKIKAAMKNQGEDIKKIGDSIERAIEPIYRALIAAKRSVQLVSGALNYASQECGRVIGDAYSKCVSGINKAYQDCTNTLKDVQRYVPGLDITPICQILNIDDVCKLVSTDFLCSPVKNLDKVAENIAQDLINLVNQIKDWFKFKVTDKETIDKIYNVSKTPQELIAEVGAALAERKVTFTTVVDIFNKCLALALILLLTQSSFYLKNYLAKNEYDNIYITSLFKQYDVTRKEGNEPTVLPLHKKEKRVYINTILPRMSYQELRDLEMGAALLLLHMLLAALVVFIDNVFYYILFLVNKYGRVNVEVTGNSKINLRVKGGSMASFINVFINNINIENTYEASYNTTLCLPDPTTPGSDDLQILGVAYLAAFMFVLLQAYGKRFNRKICAYYYPEQEEDRIAFLHKKILFNRKKKQTFITQHIRSLQFQKEAEKRMSMRNIISPWLQSRKTGADLFCMNCGDNQSSSTQILGCKNPTCKATFCRECLNDFNHTCPICRRAY